MSNKDIRMLANMLPSIPEKDEKGRVILTSFKLVPIYDIDEEYISKMKELGYFIKMPEVGTVIKSAHEIQREQEKRYRKYDVNSVKKTDNYKVLKSFHSDIKKFSDNSELSERTRIILTGAVLKFIQKCCASAEPHTINHEKIDQLTKKIF